MTRKIISIVACAFMGVSAMAQNAYDALRFSEQYAEGTARSVAMGNAFVALGGDMGALSLNPAASAVYRFSEVVFTPSVTVSRSEADYLGGLQTGSKTRAGISNIGFVYTANTGREHSGLLNWNFSIVFNRQNNYTFAKKAYGITDQTSWLSSLAYDTDGIYAPNMDMGGGKDPFYSSGASWNSVLAWNNSLLDTLPGTNDMYIGATENLNGSDISVGGMLNQKYRSSSVGNVTEAAINWGGNFSNKLFVGVNLGIQSLYYCYDEKYAEEALDSRDFQTGFMNFSQGYKYTATGTGVNLKAGMIYVPVQWLRLGASISTPTWMYIEEEWEGGMNSQFDDGYRQSLISPVGTYNYKLNTPFRWNAGAALVLGSLGVLSMDYESVDYSRARLKDMDYEFGYDQENSEIRQLLGKQDIFRVGAEINVNPICALRGGYQYYSSPYVNGTSEDEREVMSLGTGLVIPQPAGDIFVDLTFQKLLGKKTQEFTLYGDTDIAAPVGVNKNTNWKLLLSVGYRF